MIIPNIWENKKMFQTTNQVCSRDFHVSLQMPCLHTDPEPCQLPDWIPQPLNQHVLFFHQKAIEVACLSNPIPIVFHRKKAQRGACGRARGRSGLRIGRSCTNGARAPMRDILKGPWKSWYEGAGVAGERSVIGLVLREKLQETIDFPRKIWGL